VNGKVVKTFAAIRGKIGSIGAGKSVELTVIKKDGSEKTYDVTLKKQETAKVEAASIHRMLDGAELQNSTNDQGIDIKSVEEESPAAAIGLQKGDVISGINRTRIKSIGELRSYLNDNKGVFALNIVRGNSTLFLMIR
jgi:S1-C subfamily serine protease